MAKLFILFSLLQHRLLLVWLRTCFYSTTKDGLCCCLRCMPHHILSTGQAYRATLARQLQAAAAAAASTESHNGTGPPNILLLDDFATVLDSLTAASVASALGRALLRLNMRALIATPQVNFT